MFLPASAHSLVTFFLSMQYVLCSVWEGDQELPRLLAARALAQGSSERAGGSKDVF